CADSATDLIEVLDLPVVTCNLADDDLCISDSPLTLLGASPTGGVYSGTGMVSSTVFDASVATGGVFTLTYTYTDVLGCTNTATDDMTVYDLPVVTCSLADDALCIDESPLRLLGASPKGGVYSGAGMISDTVFDPSILAQGNYTLTYTYTDANGCANTATDDMTVDALPTPTLTFADDDMCLEDAIQTLSGASPTGGVYSLNGLTLNSDKIDPSVTGEGIFTIQYTYIDVNGCVESVNDDFTVHGMPNADLGANEKVCQYLNAVLAVSESGMEYLWNTGAITQTYETNQPGPYTVSVTHPVTKCVSIGTKQLTPGPNLSVDLGKDKIVCEGYPVEFNVNAYATIIWNGDATLNGTIFKTDTTAKIDVLVIDAQGCFAMDAVNTTFVPKLDFTLRNDTTLCEEANNVVLLEVTNKNVTVEWNDGSVDLAYEAIFVGEYIATITDASGCECKDTVLLGDSCSLITLTMPNIFTPNYNNINDDMRPIEMEWASPQMMMDNILYIRFYVYDRWGIMVHASEGKLPLWDGRTPSGLPCSDGIYFWDLEYMDAAGAEYDLNGFVKLLRSKTQ
ncbi:MAG: hypothetical protein ACJA0Q_001993, partial [Saprospiraceae bacterium]